MKMAPIAIGDTIPNGTLAYFDDQDQLRHVSIHSLIAGKKVVLLGVVGAFIPWCSMIHVPSFIDICELLKSYGLDDLLLISVNDPFVMKAWKNTYLKIKNVKFLADGAATYIHALGLEEDLSDKGLGVRSKTFVLLVDDLKVVIANIEPSGEHIMSCTTEVFEIMIGLLLMKNGVYA